MNHSRRFWRLVEKTCPDMARAKAWLNAHGADLHRYGMSENSSGKLWDHPSMLRPGTFALTALLAASECGRAADD